MDNVVSFGLANVTDQMQVKPADQGFMGSMVDMVSRMERSNQAMMDLMLQQAHANLPEKAGIVRCFQIICSIKMLRKICGSSSRQRS